MFSLPQISPISSLHLNFLFPKSFQLPMFAAAQFYIFYCLCSLENNQASKSIKIKLKEKQSSIGQKIRNKRKESRT